MNTQTVRIAPSKHIEFDGNEYSYFRNKRNILLYKGRSRRANYKVVVLVVLYNPEDNTYYVLHKISHVTHWSDWSDVADEEDFETTSLEGINRMARPVNV